MSARSALGVVGPVSSRGVEGVAAESERAVASARDEFLAVLVHELRTPLSTVLGMQELVLAGSLSEDQRGSLLAAQRAGETLLRRMNDLLGRARAEAQADALRARDFDLAQTLADCVELGAPEARRKNLRLGLCVESPAPSALNGDVARLQQILGNLISNAVKFTDEGGVLVYARVRPGASGSTAVLECWVIDTGPGVEPSLHAQLFHPFVQGAAGLRLGTGSGLGLSITRQLVQGLGGELSLDAAATSAGAAFRVELPFAVASRPAQARATLELGLNTFGAKLVGPSHLGGPPSVLVVDDHDVNRRMFAQFVRCLGCETAEAANGREALAQLSAEHYDAVLLDLQMPVLDGWETIAQLRAREAEQGLKRTRVIAVSAATEAEVQARAGRVGADGFLPKPLSLRRMREALALLGVLPASEDPVPLATSDSGTMPRVSPPSGVNASLDPSTLRSLRRYDRPGRPSVMAEVVGLFLKDLPERLGALRSALEQHDDYALAAQAHAVAGACANVGATRASTLAWWLELGGRLPRDHMALGLLGSLRDEQRSLEGLLALLLNEAPAVPA